MKKNPTSEKAAKKVENTKQTVKPAIKKIIGRAPLKGRIGKWVNGEWVDTVPAKPKPAHKKVKAPVKSAPFSAGGTIFVKANPEIANLLKGFYKDMASSFQKMVDKATAKGARPTQEQLQAKFDKVADEWAIEVDKVSGKANMIKFSFTLPKTKKAYYKKVSPKKK